MARTIEIVPYDKSWKNLYEIEKGLLESIFNNIILDIQHFGSTSIPGLAAKPIIDIMIIVDDINEVDKYNKVMGDEGYVIRGENGMPGRRYFVKMKNENSGNHTHHIHIYQNNNICTSNYIIFRDYLKINNAVLKMYESVKKDLALKYRDNPLEYTNGKTDCVNKILEEARLYFHL
jgi:GrpB-like predicted nucleotidyltransferase (UPF0157 family)